MSKNKSDEPRDEFDHVQIPEFLARPFERLARRPAAGQPAAGRPARPSTSDRVDESTDADGNVDADTSDDTEPVQRQWWAGYKGKMLLYGVGTLVMVFLQSRT